MELKEFTCRENIDIDEYYSYFIKIKNEMDHPEWLGDLEKDDFKFLLENGAKSWTYFDGENFVCSFMYIVATQNAIKHLGIDYAVEECAECGPMFVAKEFRGNGLQFQMFQMLEKYCKEHDFKYILTTAEPNNVYSSNNMEIAGYQKKGFRVLERGPRNIYVREIR